MERLCQVFHRAEAPAWAALARMEPLDAARWFNGLHAQVEEQNRRGAS
jgi:hypothetical protein